MALNVINSNTPGGQALVKAYENDLINQGRADRGLFNKVELDDLYTHLGNIRQYEREVQLGGTVSSYTNWTHVQASDGYSVWKYPVSSYINNTNNEVYNDDIKLDYKGIASSESTALGFNKVFSSNSKRSGATFTDNTTEAASSSGTPFDLISITNVINETVSAVYSGTAILLDYENIIDGSVVITNATASTAYTEDTDYTMGYMSGTIITLSAGSIASGDQCLITYDVGNTIYLGSSGTFGAVNLDVATKGVGARLAFNYSSGSNWPSFTPSLDSTNAFSVDGNITWSSASLTGWTTGTVNASAGIYWVKARVTQAGIAYPTAYHIVRADTAATKLLAMSQIDLINNKYKWCYFNSNIYVAIPNTGNSINEGVTYVKTTSDNIKKQNYFVYNNSYITNYYNTTSGALTIQNSLIVSGDLTVGGNFNISGGIFMSGDLTLSGRIFTDAGTSAAPAWTFRTASDTGWFLDTSGKLCATVDGDRVISLSSGSSTISLHKNTVVSGTLQTTGDLTVGGNFYVSGSVVISGGTTISGNLNIDGNLNVSGTLTVSAATVLANTLHTTGNITTSGTLAVTSYFGTNGETGDATYNNDFGGTGRFGGHVLVDGIDIVGGGSNQRIAGQVGNDFYIGIGGDSLDTYTIFEQGGGITVRGPSVFNETGLDVDFRIESSAVTHALFVQGSTGNVGIGTASPSSILHINGNTRLSGYLTITSGATIGGAVSTQALTATGNVVINNTAGQNVNIYNTDIGPYGAYFNLSHLRPTPQNNDALGNIGFKGYNSSSTLTEYVRITALSTTITSGSEAGLLEFEISNTVDGARDIALSLTATSADLAGALHTTGNITTSGTTSLDGAVVINDSGNDVDFRVESSAVTNALFVDGSTGRVGIGTTSPASTLHVNGNTRLSGYLTTTSGATIGGATTFAADVNIAGNLTVLGTTTTISSTNLTVKDPLILLAKDNPTDLLDIGLIGQRNSANVGMIWDESADEFAVISTTDDGTTSGNITIASYHDFHGKDATFTNIAGTLSTAAQGNVTSLGTLAGLTVTATITGSINGNAATASQLYINNDDTGDTNCPILFTADSTAGNKAVYEDSAVYIDNTANNIHATGFTGALTGNASTATTLQTTRAIYGNNFNGSAALTQVIASTYGGTGNGFTKFTGPATAERTFTLPNANATLLYSGGALGTPSGGTLSACTFPTLNQNTTGNAATVTTNANLTGDVTSIGNATTIGADKVHDTMIDWGTGAGQVSTTDMTEGTNLYYTEARVSGTTTVSANKAFRVTPSTIISTGTNLSWSGNTLNSTDQYTGTVTSVVGGNGLSGTVSTTGNINMGIPGTLTNATTNAVTSTSHTHEVTGMDGTVTSVTGTAPISVATGTTTPVISMAVAGATASGYVTAGNQTFGGIKTFNAGMRIHSTDGIILNSEATQPHIYAGATGLDALVIQSRANGNGAIEIDSGNGITLKGFGESGGILTIGNSGDPTIIVSNDLLVSGDILGNLTGNASTASALQTARTIAGVSFDGTTNISLNNNAITNGAGYATLAGPTFTGTVTLPTWKGSTGASVTVINTSFSDDDTSLMTSQAIKEKIENYGYSTTTGTLSNVVEDTTPQLGGNLDFNSNGLSIYGQTVGGSNGNVVYLSASGTWANADASVSGTCDSAIGIQVSAAQVLTYGIYTTTGLTAGAVYYVSETAGAKTTTAPSTSTSIVRIIGYAVSTTEFFVCPDPTYVEVA